MPLFQKLITSIIPQSNLKRAPSYALLQVSEGETNAFSQNIARLATIFDSVLVLWPEGNSQPAIPGNVTMFASNTALRSRWQLIKSCADGFVFPISLEKPIHETHATKLKNHLFLVGGTAAVGMFNFEEFIGENIKSVASAGTLVPMPEIDVDYAVLDQRFWKLSGEEFIGFEDSKCLAVQAFKRGFDLFAFNEHGSVSQYSKGQTTIYSQEDLAESALRNTFFLERQNDESLSFWLKVWDFMGIPAKKTPLEARNSLLEYAELGKNILNDVADGEELSVEHELSGSEL